MDERDGEWIVAGASVRGTSHERREQPCQDAHRTLVTNNGEILVAVADGTGSARYSEEGATTAVDAAIDFLKERISGFYKEGEVWQTLLRGAAAHALQALKELAGEMNEPVRELSCTLLLAVATRERFFALQIGDGAIVRETPNGPEALFKPTSGEYINESVFLVTKGAIEQAKLAERAGPNTPFAVFSDGLQMLALRMPEGAPEPGFFKPLFKLAKKSTSRDEVKGEIKAFLGSSRVRERADDDLTLVLASPRGADALDKGDTGPASLPRLDPSPPEDKPGATAKLPPPPIIARPAGSKESSKTQAARGQTKASAHDVALTPAHKDARSERNAEKRQGVTALVMAFGLGMVLGGAMVYLLMRNPAPEPNSKKDPNLQTVDHKPQLSPQTDEPQVKGGWLDGCESDAQCGPLLTCVHNSCRTKRHLGEACNAKDVCVAGAVCERGACRKLKTGKKLRDPCSSDEECVKELVCVMSRCTDQKRGPEQGCRDDNDCDDAYSLRCESGHCMPRWP